jgi:hypothetical protein
MPRLVRALAPASLAALAILACRAPQAGTEPEAEPCRIEIDSQQDPNDARESYWEILIFPGG